MSGRMVVLGVAFLCMWSSFVWSKPIVTEEQVCNNQENGQCTSTSTSSSTKRNEQGIPSSTQDASSAAEDQCKLYLAPSSIPNAGLGIFTSVPLKTGDEVGSPEMLIPVPDFRNEYALIMDVAWGCLVEDVYFESLGPMRMFYPGFGAAINCHLGLTNVEHGTTAQAFASAGVQRGEAGAGAFTYYHGMNSVASKDVEAGMELFVDYGEDWFTTRTEHIGHLPLYESYPRADRILNSDFVRRMFYLEEDEPLASAAQEEADPLTADKDEAEPTTQNKKQSAPRSFLTNYDQDLSTSDHVLYQDIWSFLRNSVDDAHHQAALPEELAEAQIASLMGSSNYVMLRQRQHQNNTDKTTGADKSTEADSSPTQKLQESLQNQLRRSPEYLQTHGRCVDHIHPGPSTLDQAGMGAYSKHFIPQGSVVSPLPVMPMKRQDLDFFHGSLVQKSKEAKRRENLLKRQGLGLEEEEEEEEEEEDELSEFTMDSLQDALAEEEESDESVSYNEKSTLGTQLLMNYVFTHPQSSIVLIPYAPLVNYVNHNATLANVGLRWSSTSAYNPENDGELVGMNQDDWLSYPPSKLLEQSFGLVMEFVALRDIQPGEELFLDYGAAWEEAWQKHKAKVSSKTEQEQWMTSQELRRRLMSHRRQVEQDVLHDEGEAKDNHVPLEVMRTEKEQASRPYPDNVNTACFYIPEPLREEQDFDQDDYEIQDVAELVSVKWAEHHRDCLRPCRIVKRHCVSFEEHERRLHLSFPNGVPPEKLAMLRNMRASIVDDDNDMCFFYYDVEVHGNGGLPHLHEACLLPTPKNLLSYDRMHYVQRVPFDAVSFVDVPYTRDAYEKEAFRHGMGVPEGVFPKAWMDLKVEHVANAKVEKEEEKTSHEGGEKDEEDNGDDKEYNYEGEL